MSKKSALANGIVAVTGAGGFVGSSLCLKLCEKKQVRAVVRSQSFGHSNNESVSVWNIEADPNWQPVLSGVATVIHLAARVHVMNDSSRDPLVEYRKDNVEYTLNLARQAVDAGVRRFIFVSSIKVNGEITEKNSKFFADDIPNPKDAYGISKLEAELGLIELSKKTGLEIVIIRPPLVYGPGVKANFRSMMKLLTYGMPLPFASIHNLRSLVAIDNLVDLIVTCIDHPKAANQIFLVSDAHDVSTGRLFESISLALGVKSRLIPMPQMLLRVLFFVSGKKYLSQRLLDSLQIDITKTKLLLDWSPPVSYEKAIIQTARAFINAL